MISFRNNPEVIQNYDLFQRVGIFQYVDELNMNIKNLEELVTQASDIFSRTSIESLIDYVIECLVDKFIPSNLVFLLEDARVSEEIQVISYRNLKKVRSEIKMTRFSFLENFFVRYPASISFSLLEYQLQDQETIDQLLPADPDIVIPIVGPSGLYGIILFGKKLLEGEYSDNEIKYIDRLMRFVSIAAQNNIHYKNSVTDEKTGLYNHAFYVQRLREEMARVRRNNSPLSLIMSDIDHFKLLNDKYGHLAGDSVLVELAQLFQTCIRAEDVVARFGGEEFTLMLRATNALDAYKTAERIRDLVESTTFRYKGIEMPVNISLGCSTWSEFNNVNEMELLRQADEALYFSKEHGRNQTSFYRGGLLLSASQSRQKP